MLPSFKLPAPVDSPGIDSSTNGDVGALNKRTRILETDVDNASDSDDKNLSALAKIGYAVPKWAGDFPPETYKLEVIKDGQIADVIELKKSTTSLGRGQVDIVMQHPSSSRLHAVLQFSTGAADDKHPRGFYLFDLNSAHGSFVNKIKIPPETFYRICVGYVMKFAGSSRIYILAGPEDEEEEQSELSVTQLKAMQRQQAAIIMNESQKQKAKREAEESGGCLWGMTEDAEDEDPDMENPYAVIDDPTSQLGLPVLDISDPKKLLRGWFEREGCELSYDVDEVGFGAKKQFRCRIVLPVDGKNGKPLMAEAIISGKKKEAVAACALEACHILDAAGVLRQARARYEKRKKDWEAEDFYDSDDDNFLDRTGEIERKRQKRMQHAGKIQQTVESFATLSEKLKAIEKEIQVNQQLISVPEEKLGEAAKSGEDSLDEFMDIIETNKTLEKNRKLEISQKVQSLLKEKERLSNLLEAAAPVKLPSASQPKIPFASRAIKKRRIPPHLRPSVDQRPLEMETHDDDLVEEVEEEEKEEENIDKKDNLKMEETKVQEEMVEVADVAMKENADEKNHLKTEKTNVQETMNVTDAVMKECNNGSGRGEMQYGVKDGKQADEATTGEMKNNIELHEAELEMGSDVKDDIEEEKALERQEEEPSCAKNKGIGNEKEIIIEAENEKLSDEETKMKPGSMPGMIASYNEGGQTEADGKEGIVGTNVTDKNETAKESIDQVAPFSAFGGYAHMDLKRKPIKSFKTTPEKYDESDPKYAMWLPPKDQSGDGKTSLNSKYGY